MTPPTITPVYETYTSERITDAILDDAATLFSEHYGVWSADKPAGTFGKVGSHIRLTPQRLQRDYLPTSHTSYVRVLVDGTLVGQAFACRWTTDEGTTDESTKKKKMKVCWVTQLVVHRDYRERRLACGLLERVRSEGGDEDDVYGIMSSHPAACLAAGRAFGGSQSQSGSQSPIPISLPTIATHAPPIMKASPVRYIRDAELRGTLFDASSPDALVSCADVRFFVDHREPLEALERVRAGRGWALGELWEGYEFVLVVKGKGGGLS